MLRDPDLAVNIKLSHITRGAPRAARHRYLDARGVENISEKVVLLNEFTRKSLGQPLCFWIATDVFETLYLVASST